MFGLSADQEEIVKQSTNHLKPFLQSEAAPEALKHLENTKKLLEENQHALAIEYAEKNTQILFADLLRTASPEVTRFLLTLDEDNAINYREYIRENSGEWFEYASSEESKDDARTEQLENWFGELTPDQKSKAKVIVHLLPDEQQIRFDNTNHWVNLALKASLSRDQAALEAWVSEPSIWWLEDYKSLRKANRQQLMELAIMMAETMNGEQKAFLLERIDDWINKIQEVI